jgi:hypothetical protein
MIIIALLYFHRDAGWGDLVSPVADRDQKRRGKQDDTIRLKGVMRRGWVNFGSLESLRDCEPELYHIYHLFSLPISVLQSSSGQLEI